MPGPGASAPEEGGVQELLGMLAPTAGFSSFRLPTGGSPYASYPGAAGGGPAATAGPPPMEPGAEPNVTYAGMNIPQSLAPYFNAVDASPVIDDPRKVAAEGGVSLSQLASGFFPRTTTESRETRGGGYEYPSDKGGFFSLRGLFDQTGTPSNSIPNAPGGLRQGMPNVHSGRVGQLHIPAIGTWGKEAPSTNNWRLLGREPGYIMRNGFLIRTHDAGGWQEGGPAGYTASGGNSGEQFGQGLGRISLGTGANYGLPNLYSNGGQPSSAGWPGAEQWVPVFPGNVG